MESWGSVMSLTREQNRLVDSAKRPVSSPSEKEVVEANVRSKLQRSCYPLVRRVSCDFHEGVLTLRGRVSSYYLKQVVQTLVFRLDGVVELNNQVEVVYPPRGP
jgi:osmotically-inducible protein OsmY